MRIWNFRPQNVLIIKNWLQKPIIMYALVAFFGLLNSYLLNPFLNLSMAISASEEGPIQPSTAFKNPDIFAEDIFAQNNKYLMWTSSTKWIPALLYKYLNIDPVIFHVLFTYSQTTLLLLSVYYLSQSLFKDSRTGIFSVLLVVILSPYFNNLGSYGDLYFMPYSTWISIPPLLFCLAFLINKKFKKSILYYVIGLSIHPAMGITLFGFICATVIMDKTLIHKQRFKLLISYAVPITIYSLIILLIQNLGSSQSVPESWVLESKKLFHWSAWELNPTSNSFQTTSYTISLFTATILGVIYFKFIGRYNRNLILLYSIVVLISVIVQATAYTMNMRAIYTLNFSRITIFMSIFSTIIFSRVLIRELFENKKLKITSVFLITFILLQSYTSLILFSTIVLFLLQNQIEEKFKQNIVRILVLAVPLLLTILYFATLTNKWLLIPGLEIIYKNQLLVPNGIAIRGLVYYIGSNSLIFVIVSLLILMLITIRNERLTRIILLIAVVFLVSITLSIRFVQSETRLSQHQEWTEIQLWAQKKTNPDSRFILDGDLDTYASWTTLARRPRLTSFNGPQSVYLHSNASVRLDNIRIKLGRIPALYDDNNSIEKFYYKFSMALGGDYLVRRVEWTQLNWQVIYKNSKYIIYKIPKIRT